MYILLLYLLIVSQFPHILLIDIFQYLWRSKTRFNTIFSYLFFPMFYAIFVNEVWEHCAVCVKQILIVY